MRLRKVNNNNFINADTEPSNKSIVFYIDGLYLFIGFNIGINNSYYRDINKNIIRKQIYKSFNNKYHL